MTRELQVETTVGLDIYRAGTGWEYELADDLRLTVTTTGTDAVTVYAPGHWLKIGILFKARDSQT